MRRDLDKEKIIDKMRQLRDKRELEILQKYFDEQNENGDFKKELFQNKVLDVKYLDTIDLEDPITGEKIEKQIYLIIEQMKRKDGKIIEIEKYYTEDFEFLGGINRDSKHKDVMLKEELAKNTKLAEKIKGLDKEGKIDLKNIEDERLEEIAKTLGVKVDELTKIDEIDTEQKVDGKEINEDELKGLNIKEETLASTNLKGETLGKKLGLPPDVKKIARVSADSLNRIAGTKNNNIDAFVGIKNDGTAVKLGEDILTLDNSMGINPNKSQTTISNDGKVEKEAITSSYLIVNGNGREYLQIGNDEVSGKEIKYTQKSTTSNENLAVELSTQRTLPQDYNVRQYLKDRSEGKDDVNKVLNRDKVHGECDEKDVTVIDNDKNNDSHQHHTLEIEDEYLNNSVRKILDTPILNEESNITIADFEGRDAVKNAILNEMKKNDYSDIDEVVKKVTEKYKENLNEEAKEKEELGQEHDRGSNYHN